MATRITVKGQVTIPKKMRDALRLSPGDGVEFTPNASGEIVVSKARSVPAPLLRSRERLLQPRTEAQMRRRAAELLALLRGLD
jgi:AbrB family looped-hinge helix DNA binding protein